MSALVDTIMKNHPDAAPALQELLDRKPSTTREMIDDMHLDAMVYQVSDVCGLGPVTVRVAVIDHITNTNTK